MSQISDMKTVLIVDDEEVIRVLLNDVLTMYGYRTISCGIPEEAVEVYRSRNQDIDLVLMDMMMPGMNGQQLFWALKAINQDVKVVILSGYSMIEEVEGLILDGALGYTQKPVTIAKLRAVIDQALQEDNHE